MENARYAGFWLRFLASMIDVVLMLMIIIPLLLAIYGTDYWLKPQMFAGVWDVVLNYVMPAIVVLVFWKTKSATPGKLLLKLIIVDAATGGKLSNGQMVGRYFAYLLSTLPLGLGFLWIAFDPKKQAWHDKLSSTLVIRRPPQSVPAG